MSISNEKYILHGPVPLVPISEKTAGEQLFAALTRYQHLPAAVICAETRKQYSYRNLLECSCQLAQGLRKLGLGPGSTIAIFSENNIFFYYAILASLYLGITVAPLSPDYIGKELYHAAGISKPQILFCSKKTYEKSVMLRLNISCIKKIVVLDLNTSNDEEALCNLLVEKIELHNFRPLEFDPKEQVAFILCSSGTTGLPKGVMITHYNLSAKFAQLKDPVSGFVSKLETRALSILPMYHIGGLCSALIYLLFGFYNITMQRFSKELYLRLIEDYKVETSFIAPPTMNWLAKTSLINKYNLSSILEIICGAAPLSKDIIIDVLQRLPTLKEIRQAYGLTEATLTVTLSPRGDAKIGSSGKLHPHTLAKVIDFDTKKTLGPNQHGELCFKGAFVMKGYIGHTCDTENIVDKDGWLHTGDIGYYDDEEHFYIVDRLKELIKYKGHQVSPAELETLLLHHPKIKDVAVIGVDDEFAGQLPRAYVVKHFNSQLSEQEVVDFVKGHVSHHKHLRGGVVFIDSIPRIPSGKIARKQLRELGKAKLSKL